MNPILLWHWRSSEPLLLEDSRGNNMHERSLGRRTRRTWYQYGRTCYQYGRT
ncbi:hypothetical protein FKM82_014737 [Ascaphus truei]